MRGELRGGGEGPFTIGSDWQAVKLADTFVRIAAFAAHFKVNH